MSTEEPNTIMAIGAHHDDNELVAGTLSRHKEAGWRIVSVVMTDGLWISGGKVSRSHIAIRESESREAAQVLGAECVFMRFGEGAFQPNEEARLALVRVLRQHRPRIVITHPPDDYHLDHMSTSRCAFEALYLSWNPCVLTEVPACPAPKLYYSDAWFVPFTPDEYVDIGKFIDRKLDMLRCHKSQLGSGEDGETDMVAMAKHQSRMRGIEAGVRYAEAFRLVPRLGSVRMSGLLSP